MAALFYDPDIRSNWILNDEESRHAIKSLRVKNGDTIDITTGNNDLIQVEVIEVTRKNVHVKEIDTVENVDSRPFEIHLALAPTKNLDRIEWLVEKATEIGVDQFTFLTTDHTERKFLKSDRLLKKAVSALKQSKKTKLPVVTELISFKDFISQANFDYSFIAHLEEGDRKYISNLLLPFKAHSKICILIGPEGDFSPNEIELALEQGFKAVSLGDYRLRTETAALAACHEIHVLSKL